MIRTPTVFILGAGASAPYGFPIGSQLVADIIELHHDEKAERAGFDRVVHSDFVKALSKSDRNSIDEFLSRYPDFADIGRYVIARILSECERTHTLNRSPVPTQKESNTVVVERRKERSKGRWYHYLLDKLQTENPEDLLKNNVTFITFNYDRSFDQYLWNRLKWGYNLPEDAASEIAIQIPIVHVHGQIGVLPWDHRNSGGVLEYGGNPEPDYLRRVSQEIKIIHDETLNDCDPFKIARKWIGNAESIVFLGFGYHRLNMKRMGLTLPEIVAFENKKRIYGTCFCMTEAELQIHRESCIGVWGNLTFDVLDFLRNTEDILRL